MTEPSSSLCVISNDLSQHAQAKQFAETHKLPLFTDRNPDCALQLCFMPDRIELYDTQLNTSIHVDFVEGALAHRRQYGGGRGQAIARAVGLKHGNTPSVLDITAGLGRDAYILAALGCKLTLVEQSPVLYTLIKDGIRRGLEHPDSKAVLNNFMNLVYGDSITYMEQLSPDTRPDVIYMDPMYPERKKTALVKKDMQILQRLIGKGDNTEQLLATAMGKCRQRVVVKRPVHADSIPGPKPSTSICSKKTRYDCYITG